MSRRAWRSWPLILASSLLPGLVLFAWRAGSAPSAPSDSYVDGIVVTPVIADLGAIAAGETQEVVFRLANQRNAPVIIGSVTSDCGCTTVRQPRGAIEPGRFADFPVAYQASPSAAGEYAFVRRVTVRLTVDAKEREIDLRLTGRVVPRRSFGVYPSTLDYGDVGPGAQLTKFLHVRGAPGAVHAFPDALTLDAPGQERSVRVDYGTPVGDAVQKRVAVSLHVPDGAKPGLWEAQITLVDSGSTVSSERTVRIVARVRSPVVVEPSAVLLVLGHGKTAGAQITVTAHGQPRTACA